MAKLNFQQPLIQSSTWQDPSEIFLICWFGTQETFAINIVPPKSKILEIHTLSKIKTSQARWKLCKQFTEKKNKASRQTFRSRWHFQCQAPIWCIHYFKCTHCGNFFLSLLLYILILCNLIYWLTEFIFLWISACSDWSCDFLNQDGS